MDKYYTLPELYETKEIDEAFVEVYNKLYEKAKARVRDKNVYLRAYLDKPRESSYDALDFKQDAIMVECVFLRQMTRDMQCAEGHELKKSSIRNRVKGRLKGIYLMTCPICKRIYSDMTEDIEKLEHLGIPYYIVEEGKNRR